jgi:carboxymethylenebutenolidase
MSQFIHLGNDLSDGYLALPESGNGPGVLVLHAWWGRTATIEQLCDRLAGAGFVALAPDMFAGRTATTPEEAEALVSEFEGERGEEVQRAVDAGLDALLAHPAVSGDAVAVVGLSFGAAWALLLSTQQPERVEAVACLYGTYPLDFTAVRARYQLHLAAHDPYEPEENVQAMRDALSAAGCEAEFYTYPNTGHWFFEPDRVDAYNAEAAELVWERLVAFLGR